mmetsp:Transcript_7935/g.22511  ORF Transcript_7935/g.22511 Transcript_7935/m.22511 type:complete len:88 (+) Transcript_7935:100-363(+)
MVTAEDLKAKIVEKLSPADVVLVSDESDGCGAKFSVVVVCSAFEGVPLLDRQRIVNEAIKEEMKTIHALSMKTWTPAQWEKKKANYQ